MCMTPSKGSVLSPNSLNPHAKAWIPLKPHFQNDNNLSKITQNLQPSMITIHQHNLQPMISMAPAPPPLSPPGAVVGYHGPPDSPPFISPSYFQQPVWYYDVYSQPPFPQNGIFHQFPNEYYSNTIIPATPGMGCYDWKALGIQNQSGRGFHRKGEKSIHFDYNVSQKKTSKRSLPPRLREPSDTGNGIAKEVKKQWKPRKPKTGDRLRHCSGFVSSTSIESDHSTPAVLSQNTLESGKTSVMIKNIPNQLRRSDMVEFLDKYCIEHDLKYDFLYLPMDFTRKDNFGYAFVNFTNAEAALKIKEVLQDYKWGLIRTLKGEFISKKICEVTWARIQGKEELMKRFANSYFSCDRIDFLPVIFNPPRDGSSCKTSPVTIGKMQPPFVRKK